MRYNRLKVSFLLLLKCQIFKSFWMGWVKSLLFQRWKIAVCWKLQLIFERNGLKRVNSNFSWFIINALCTANRWKKEPGLEESGAPFRVPTWVELAHYNAVLKKKTNEVSENLSFDLKLILLLEIWPFKFASFLTYQYFKALHNGMS